MKLRGRTSTRKLIISMIGLVLFCFGAGVGVAFMLSQRASTLVPQAIQSGVQFPVLVPKELPSGFSVDKNSFTKQESGSVVLFSAKDDANQAITFTEQAKPKDLNFSDFYASKMKNAATLNDVPYASTWGTSTDGKQRILSVTTDSTWILMTTLAPIDEGGMKLIAKSLR